MEGHTSGHTLAFRAMDKKGSGVTWWGMGAGELVCEREDIKCVYSKALLREAEAEAGARATRLSLHLLWELHLPSLVRFLAHKYVVANPVRTQTQQS